MTASPMDPGHDCARAWELMPAALLGHADEERGRWLASHLGRCEACSAEFAQQQRLRRALSLPTALPLDPQAGLRRLLERIDAPPAQAAPARSRGWAIKALAASVLIQAVGLGVLSSQLYAANQRAGYRTLSDAPAAAPTPPAAIRVVPDPTMPLGEWNALLRGLELQVVEGPNAVGAYLLAPAAPTQAQAAQLLQRLRSAPGIRLAESVAAR